MKIQGNLNLFTLINRLHNKYKAVSSSNSLTHYRLHAIAGVLGLSGLVLAIRDVKFGSLRGLLPSTDSSSSSEELCFIAGLQNLGNNCFLNVILQALASCGTFNEFIQSLLDEEDSFLVEDRVEKLPLTVALVSLFKELCIPHSERMTLSPRRVMLAMDHYIPSFNLTRQQDAAEAFLHLLSSLKEEISECYVQRCSSLADISTFPLSRISIPRSKDKSEREKWQWYLLGPFDGILCSILACKSCSSQLSMDFEFFHSLPLSPMLDRSGTIMRGTSVEDCLKQFTATEPIENYRCNQCWHNKAMKYLCTIQGVEAQMERLKCCIGEDFCDCRDILSRDGILLTNDSSCTIKQLWIARPPKVLCIHLQRALVNQYGDVVKYQGHISFPMILDLYQFTKEAIGGIKRDDGHVGITKVKQHQPLVPHFSYLNMQFGTQMLHQMYRATEEHVNLQKVLGDKLEYFNSSGNKFGQPFEGESYVQHSVDCSEITETSLQSDNKVQISKIDPVVPSKNYVYQLVSVVEHFGKVGSGHYTVYRRARGEADREALVGCSLPVNWFCASDSQVFSVSEKDVLAAEYIGCLLWPTTRSNFRSFVVKRWTTWLNHPLIKVQRKTLISYAVSLSSSSSSLQWQQCQATLNTMDHFASMRCINPPSWPNKRLKHDPDSDSVHHFKFEFRLHRVSRLNTISLDGMTSHCDIERYTAARSFTENHPKDYFKRPVSIYQIVVDYDTRHDQIFTMCVEITIVNKYLYNEREILEANLRESIAENEQEDGYGFVPADDNVINKLERVKFDSQDSITKSCTVCLQDFKTGSIVTRMPCAHCFHRKMHYSMADDKSLVPELPL